jgi:shikimate dehydrogenase
MSEIVISGKTKVCGIIGDPIEHTLSPAMQNAAFNNLGLDYAYLPFKVAESNLGEALRGLKALDFVGVNVTIPHKVAVIPLLDELDGLAQHIGAVNTIVNRGGILKGYNTDASGFYQALAANKIKVSKKKVVIIGAGGAARAIAFTLADKGAELMILNRSLGPVKTLGEHVFQSFRTEVKTGQLSFDNLKAALEESDILVNTTSAGMSPNVTETPVPRRLLKKGLIVFDIVYNPLKTRLLREAEEKGAQVIGGLDMLVKQGAAAFELWTGVKAPVDIMRISAKEALKNEE